MLSPQPQLSLHELHLTVMFHNVNAYDRYNYRNHYLKPCFDQANTEQVIWGFHTKICYCEQGFEITVSDFAKITMHIGSRPHRQYLTAIIYNIKDRDTTITIGYRHNYHSRTTIQKSLIFPKFNRILKALTKCKRKTQYYRTNPLLRHIKNT